MIDVDATIDQIWKAAQTNRVPVLDGCISTLSDQLLQVCLLLDSMMMPIVSFIGDRRTVALQ